jgi:sterol 24-C-methyltransferase
LTCADSVKDGVTDYATLHNDNATSTQERRSSYQALVNAYYDLATVFYEWGWGSSFHFSFQYPWESFYESIRRHEYILAAQLGPSCYGPSKHVLDVGCGIAGPARNIATLLQCRITGLTLNHYQVQRGNELNAAAAAYANVNSVQGDFMALPFEPKSFDGAYAIEATCHAPDRTACYQQIFNILKSGAIFACYEWCLTDLYDASNPEHVRLKKDMELGNGLPDICNTKECLQALHAAGFEVITETDLAVDVRGANARGVVQPWMTPLQPSWNILSQRFQFNPVGAVLTNMVIASLEFLRIAPAGTVQTQRILQAGGFALRDAGAAGIFTTMYLLVGRKPM